MAPRFATHEWDPELKHVAEADNIVQKKLDDMMEPRADEVKNDILMWDLRFFRDDVFTR